MNGRFQAVMALGLGFALLAPASSAQAEGQVGDTTASASGPAVGTAEAVAAARTHFMRGRDLYQAGSYREAIAELDAARALDPKAKDLVFNLAVVHEKLGEIDEALRYARLYAMMDLEPADRTRAETYIKRLEGAKAEVLARKAGETPETTTATSPPAAASAPPQVRGRLDAATLVVAAVAVGAAGVGTVIGIKALNDRPSNFAVGKNGVTAASLQSQVDSAHSEAVVADVCFGGAAAAAAAAVVLYFARYRDVSAPKTALSPTAGDLTLAPLVGKSMGGFSLGGSF